MKPMENTSFLDFFGFNSLFFASRAKVCPLCAVGALWWPGSMLGGSKSLFLHPHDWLINFLTRLKSDVGKTLSDIGFFFLGPNSQN